MSNIFVGSTYSISLKLKILTVEVEAKLDWQGEPKRLELDPIQPKY